MATGKYDQQVLKAAREQFADFGYFGARIDTIANTARVNKRMVYEFCHTKDGLYMIALSDVSREAMERFHQVLPSILQLNNIRSVYAAVLDMFDTLGSFVRLWAWERMYMTIHGPRLLETANTIFGRIREVVKASFPEKRVSDTTFDAIESLCHSYMLASAMYTQNENEETQAEPTVQNGEHAQNVSIYTKDIVLNSIFQLVRN